MAEIISSYVMNFFLIYPFFSLFSKKFSCSASNYLDDLEKILHYFFQILQKIWQKNWFDFFCAHYSSDTHSFSWSCKTKMYFFFQKVSVWFVILTKNLFQWSSTQVLTSFLKFLKILHKNFNHYAFIHTSVYP